jgi:hypothetical protein
MRFGWLARTAFFFGGISRAGYARKQHHLRGLTRIHGFFPSQDSSSELRPMITPEYPLAYLLFYPALISGDEVCFSLFIRHATITVVSNAIVHPKENEFGTAFSETLPDIHKHSTRRIRSCTRLFFTTPPAQPAEGIKWRPLITFPRSTRFPST